MERMEIKGVGHSPNITNEASSFLSLNTKNSPGDIQHKFGLTRSAFPHAAQELLRGLLPFGAKLVVEEQETDYEMYTVNEHGLEMYLPIQPYCIPENTR
jgi:hypothetical protein